MALDILLVNVRSWANLKLSALHTRLLRTAEAIPYLGKGSRKNKKTTLLLTTWWMKFRTIESKKASAVNNEAPHFLESDYDDNDLHQVENMILDETKEKIELLKRALEYKSSYVIENRDKMIHVHDNEVNNMAECNLLHYISNPPKRAKYIYIHYSPILHGILNTRKGRAKFKNFPILLDS